MQQYVRRLTDVTIDHYRLRRWRWLLPLGLILLVAFYEIGPARWIYGRFGFAYHIVADIIIFGTIGPTLLFLTLNFISRWLEERETSDLQAKLLAQSQQEAHHSRQLNDDAVQILFAASVLIDSLKSSHASLPPDTTEQIETMEKSLQQAIEQLRAHLLD